MDFASGTYGDRELTLLRAGFSGELAYELHVRPVHALALWEALVANGLPPYGLDALDILRVEKGYLSSSELNGETAPADLNLEALVRLGNPCVGRDLLDRAAFQQSIPATPGRPARGGFEGSYPGRRATHRRRGDGAAMRLRDVRRVQPRARAMDRARARGAGAFGRRDAALRPRPVA